MLEALEIRSNPLTPVGAALLAQALSCNIYLLAMTMDFKDIKAEGVEFLCQALHVNTTLKVLNVHGVSVCENAMFSLAEAMHYNGSIVCIPGFDDTALLYTEFQRSIQASLQRNRSRIVLNVVAHRSIDHSDKFTIGLYKMSGILSLPALELHRKTPVDHMVKCIDKETARSHWNEVPSSKYVPSVYALELVLPCSALVKTLPVGALVHDLVNHCPICSAKSLSL